MIDIVCSCGMRESLPESQAGKNWLCPSCGKTSHMICAEPLPEGAGAGDFDAFLSVVRGPARVGERFVLGGVVDIQLGKLPERHICLPGNQVSRGHCVIRRIDFGPSRWRIVDTHSTVGTFVNDQRVKDQELQPGDRIQIGEFCLQYDLREAVQPQTAQFATATTAYAAPASASPTPTIHSAKPSHGPTIYKKPANPISYRSAKEPEGSRLLGDCDIGWVMKLRNASTLMVYTLIVNSIAWQLRFFPLVDVVLPMVAAGMSLVAAWLLTSPEPEAPNRWFGVRGFLRFFAVLGCSGEILLQLNSLIGGNGDELDLETAEAGVSFMEGLGFVLVICVVPQTGLFLFYLRRLALRLPNPGLAFGATLVMVGLPTLTAMVLYSAYRAATTGLQEGIGAGLTAILGLIAMRLAYIGLLIWFNKSFS